MEDISYGTIFNIPVRQLNMSTFDSFTTLKQQQKINIAETLFDLVVVLSQIT